MGGAGWTANRPLPNGFGSPAPYTDFRITATGRRISGRNRRFSGPTVGHGTRYQATPFPSGGAPAPVSRVGGESPWYRVPSTICAASRKVLTPMPYRTLAIHQLAAMTPPETHYAPEQPFTVTQAHAVTQFHVACRATQCPRKAAALQALADAGRVIPSTTHPR